MQVERHREKDETKVVVTAEPSEYSEIEKEMYKKYRRSINVPGFRKGRVPLGLAKKHYGDDFLLDDIGELYARSAVEGIMDEEPLRGPGENQVTVESVELDDEGMRVVLSYPSRAVVRLSSEPITLDSDLFDTEVTEEEIDAEIERQLDEFLIFEPSQEAITAGDRITYDIHVYINHEDHSEVLESELNNVDILNTEGIMEEELVEFLEGKGPGEYAFTVDEDDQSEEYVVTVHAVETANKFENIEDLLPEGQYENVEEYREYLRSVLEKEKLDYKYKYLVDHLISEATQNSEIEMDEAYIDDYIEMYNPVEAMRILISDFGMPYDRGDLIDTLIDSEDKDIKLIEMYLQYHLLIDELLYRTEDLLTQVPQNYLKLLESRAKNEDLLNKVAGLNSTEVEQAKGEVINDQIKEELLFDLLYNNALAYYRDGQESITLEELLGLPAGEISAD